LASEYRDPLTLRGNTLNAERRLRPVMADAASYGDLEALLDEFQFGELETAVTLIAASSQDKQTGAATGTVTVVAPVVPAVADLRPVGGGFWWPAPAEEPEEEREPELVVITGVARSVQRRQTGSGRGAPLAIGARGVSHAEHDQTRRDREERELLSILGMLADDDDLPSGTIIQFRRSA